jgi:cobalt/nickel transport system permease protein
MLNIDKYAYSSALKKKDPMEKLTFALTTLGVCLWASSIPISVTILIIMTIATVKKGQIPFKFYLKLMLIPISFLIVGVVTIAFEISVSRESFISELFIFDRYIGLSKTGLVTATVIFFKALGSVACLYYLSLNTPMVALLSALRKMRCPKLIVELMSLIYRFIFVLMETAETMFIAQTSRLGYARLSSGYRSMGMLLSTLFIRAYKKSDELYTSLEARGYEGELNVLEESYERSFRSYLNIAGINVFLIIGTLLIRHYIGGQY